MCKLAKEKWGELDDRLVALHARLTASPPEHGALVAELRGIVASVVYEDFRSDGLLPVCWETDRYAVYDCRFGDCRQDLPQTMLRLFNCIVANIKAPPLQSERARLTSDLRDWLANYLGLRGLAVALPTQPPPAAVPTAGDGLSGAPQQRALQQILQERQSIPRRELAALLYPDAQSPDEAAGSLRKLLVRYHQFLRQHRPEYTLRIGEGRRGHPGTISLQRNDLN